MKTILLALLALTCFTIAFNPRRAAAVQVTLILRNIETDDFEEWKVKSDQKCTQSTGKIGRDTGEFEQTWDVGDPGSNIRFWWGRLTGEVDATVLVNEFVVFKGRCVHTGDGMVRMIDTCIYPRIYKTGGGGPYLRDEPECDVTYIRFNTSMLGDRFSVR